MTLTKTDNRETVTIDGWVTRFYDWGEVCAAYDELTLAHADGSNPAWDQSYVVSSIASADADDRFYSVDAQTMRERLATGYDLPKLDADSVPVADESRKPKWRFTENPDNAEYLHDAYLSGDPDYYLARDKVGPKPGINIDVRMTFRATVAHKVIGEYGSWVGSAIRAIQGTGYDVSVTCTNRVSDVHRIEDKSATSISVKRFGELNFAHDWAALFSPGGFRHLVFMAKVLPGLDEGIYVSNGLGMPDSSEAGFKCVWDATSRLLTFHCDKDARTFDPKQMTASFNDAAGRF